MPGPGAGEALPLPWPGCHWRSRNLCTKGIRTTCSSRHAGELCPPYESTVTERLCASRRGACWVKPTSNEFATWALDGEPSAFAPSPQILGTPSGCQAASSGGKCGGRWPDREANGSPGLRIPPARSAARLLCRRGRACSPPIGRGEAVGVWWPSQFARSGGPLSAPASAMRQPCLQVIAGASPVMAPGPGCALVPD